jgi:hypothetical protein
MAHDREWLVEGRRREQVRPAQPHIPLDTRLALARRPRGSENAIALDLQQWRLLSQAALGQSVRDICARSGVEPDQALDRLTELLAIGLVEIV